MSLNETTRKVLRLVEERSGIPVHVEPDPDLPGTLLATVTMARGKVALHRVVYRPNSAETLKPLTQTLTALGSTNGGLPRDG